MGCMAGGGGHSLDKGPGHGPGRVRVGVRVWVGVRDRVRIRAGLKATVRIIHGQSQGHRYG